jgi:arylsulfatase A-like enzyme/tetratricopeptide (TPR) repeat protein
MLARRAMLLATIATLTLVNGCAESAGDRAPNLLLITIDTVRADRLGCYGSADAATPNLDRIAGEGALFEKAIAVAPITLPSHVSLFTGQYPPRHGVRLNGDFRLPGAGTTLAEHLATEGYTTAAVVAAYVLSADFGIAQGFETYDEPREDREITPQGDALQHYAIVERPASEVTDAALELLDGRLETPFFLWLHYYDPHGDYTPPEPFASRFADSPYDGEIAYVDAQLGRLFDALRASGRLDRTLVAITSDHGECLGEHGENTHGLFVYDAALRVPLLLRFPARVPAGTRSDHLVAGVDLAPTLLELLGLPPMTEIEGVSFAAEARGETLPPREPAYSEAELSLRAYGWAPLHALHSGDRKFIDAPQRELYDLTADPGETRNLVVREQKEVDDWARRLAALEAGWPAEQPEAEHVLDADARARLDALGYVSSGGATPPEREERPDPKRLVQLHNLLLDAQTLVAHGALPQAQELLAMALESDPANPTTLEMSGTLFCSTGRCDVGVELLKSAARVAPHSYQTQRNLGNALHLAGRYPEAAEAYRAAVVLHPLSAEDRYALGNVLFAMREVDDAIASYEEAARLGLDSPPFHAALGVARAAAGDAEGARAALQRAVDADPELADAWNQLGILAEKADRLEEARASYGRALGARPDHVDALFNDAKVCLRLGLVDEADAGVARLFEVRPDHPAGRYLEAQVRLARGDTAAARRALEQLLAADDADPRLIAAARELLQRLED